MPSGNGSSRAGLRILVVEDEYRVADHIAVMVEDMGYEVVGPVATIEEAIALIGSEALDCVLLDANLGGKSSAPIAPRVTKPFSAKDLAAMLAGAAAH